MTLIALTGGDIGEGGEGNTTQNSPDFRLSFKLECTYKVSLRLCSMEVVVIVMICIFITGWICYAEKTHGHFILPYISTTKSPQQIMGSLVKKYFADKLKKR